MDNIGFYRNSSNNLSVQNIDVVRLIEKYGSPLYIYDGDLIRKSYLNLKKAIKPINGNVHYAVKANDNLGIIKLLSQLGCGADVVSIGELKKCMKAGMRPRNIIFSGVGKDKHEIEYAISKGIQQLNIESVEELDDVIEISNHLKQSINVAIRVNLDIKANTHEKISTGDETSKFGISLLEIPKVYKTIYNSNYLKPYGLAVHIGSQIFDIKLLKNTYSELKKLANKLIKLGFKVNNLDLGGGFGVNYKKFEIQNFKKIEEMLTKLFLGSHFKICFEPGRSLVADAGILVTKVIREKKTSAKNFLIVDAGMNDFIRPTLYNAYHRIEPILTDTSRKKIFYDIVGPICETGDYFGLNQKIQKTFKNEFLAIMSAGAYGRVMSSNYNTRPNIAEILVYNKKDYLLKNKQSITELINQELNPDI